MGLISDAALIGLTEENEEIRAKFAVLYDANDHARRLLKKADLPDADAQDIAAQAATLLNNAKRLVDSLNDAARQKGLEIADEEITALAAAAGGQHFLTAEGQVKWVAARKRASALKPQSPPTEWLGDEPRKLSLHKDAT